MAVTTPTPDRVGPNLYHKHLANKSGHSLLGTHLQTPNSASAAGMQETRGRASVTEDGCGVSQHSSTDSAQLAVLLTWARAHQRAIGSRAASASLSKLRLTSAAADHRLWPYVF